MKEDTKFVLYQIYKKWKIENKCDNVKCISNVDNICEDWRGIDNCKSHKLNSGNIPLNKSKLITIIRRK